jgi:hypothetical protein
MRCAEVYQLVRPFIFYTYGWIENEFVGYEEYVHVLTSNYGTTEVGPKSEMVGNVSNPI